MSRIDDTFADLRQKNHRALIPYAMAGYPDYDGTLKIVRGMVKGGADIIELGFPFSDPLADGPTIQNAATTSLNSGMTLSKYYSMLDEIRDITDIPMICMTYSNVAYSVGYDRFIYDMQKHGIDGIILPDMSIDESKEYRDISSRYGMDTIFLASPNSTDARCSRIIEVSDGFLYLVAIYGTTGAQMGVQRYAIDALLRIKGMSSDLPVGVGFGIRTGEDIKLYVKNGADALIVGSAILNVVQDAPHDIETSVSRYVDTLKRETTEGV